MAVDLTVGKPSKMLFFYSMPMLLSILFQQLYNIADSAIAGRFAGADALAAIGVSYPIIMLFLAIAAGFNVGCAVVISQLFGAKDYERMRVAINTSIISVLAIAALLTVIGASQCTDILRLLDTPDNIFGLAATYLNIYIYGLVFLFLYNICNGVFIALGDSKTPLHFLIASSLTNIALDLLFAGYLKMGVAGVAWATFITQGMASVLALVSLLKKLTRFSLKNYRRSAFSAQAFKLLAIMSLPSILQQSIISIGNVFIQALVNRYGSDTIAGFSAAVKLNMFALMAVMAFTNGMSGFTAQNIGAGKLARVSEGYRASMRTVIMVAVPFSLLYVFFGRFFMLLFVGPEETAVIATGAQFLYVVAPFYLVIGVKLVSDSVLRGAGSMILFMIATFSDLILRTTFAYVIVARFGIQGIWASWPIGWTVAAVISLLLYKSGAWRKRAGKIAKPAVEIQQS